jgi:hypothetical protein
LKVIYETRLSCVGADRVSRGKNTLRIAAFIYGLIGGLIGLIGVAAALSVSGAIRELSRFVPSLTAGNNTMLAITALDTLMGLFGAGVAMTSPKIGGGTLLVSGVIGFFAVKGAYFVPGGLFVVGGLLGLLAEAPTEKEA